jgi:hypothetical protein
MNMPGIEATKTPSVDLTSNDPFAAHPPVQFSIPPKPLSLEEQQRQLDLEHALTSKDGEWSRLYGHPEASKGGGFGFQVEHVTVPIKSGLTLWDLRSSSFDHEAPASNFEEHYQIKGPRFGLNWTKTF